MDTSRFLLLTAFILVFSTNSQAQGFSQLDFDAIHKEEATISEGEKNTLLEEMKNSITSEPAPKSKQASRAALKKITPEFDPEQSEFFIVPKLSGPKTDPGLSYQITSEASWLPSKRGCAFPRDEAGEISKSVALEELLFRYTGDNSFTELHCSDACEDSTQVPYLNKLKIKSTRSRSAKFNFFLKNDGQCHYRIRKGETSNWNLLKAKEVSCKCFTK